MTGVKVFFDGGCRPNPGPIETAVVVRGIAYVVSGAGIGSNGEAEWRGLLHAMRIAGELGLTDVVLVGDSLSVIRQASGRAKASPDRLAEFEKLSAGFARVRLRHIARGQNLAGIALARRHPR